MKNQAELEDLHPTLRLLLAKLGQQRFSLMDCATERLAWFWAGCPVWPTVAKGLGSYTIVCIRDSESWLAHVVDMPECNSFGKTLDEAMKNVRVALGHFFDDAETAELIQDIRYEALDG